VTVPVDCVAGETFIADLGAGGAFYVVVPHGCKPGDMITVDAGDDCESTATCPSVVVEVIVPSDCVAGQTFLVNAADGQTLSVVVPDGVTAGEMIHVTLPEAQAEAVAPEESVASDGPVAREGMGAREDVAAQLRGVGTPPPHAIGDRVRVQKSVSYSFLSGTKVNYVEGVVSAYDMAADLYTVTVESESSEGGSIHAPPAHVNSLDWIELPAHGVCRSGQADSGRPAKPLPGGHAGGCGARLADLGDFSLDQTYWIQRSDGSYSQGWIKEYDPCIELYRVLIIGVGYKYVSWSEVELCQET